MIYADTSFLISLYLPDANSPAAQREIRELKVPVAWTPLHGLEAGNAVRLAVFRKEISPAECDAVLHDLAEDQRAGALHVVTPIWDRVFEEAGQLSRGFTASVGIRSLDLLHVAVAKTLGLDRFLTFDRRQRELARKAGLAVGPS